MHTVCSDFRAVAVSGAASARCSPRCGNGLCTCPSKLSLTVRCLCNLELCVQLLLILHKRGWDGRAVDLSGYVQNTRAAMPVRDLADSRARLRTTSAASRAPSIAASLRSSSLHKLISEVGRLALYRRRM